MEYRLEQPQDRAALLALWEEVFGDGGGFAAHCLDTFAGPGNVFVAVPKGETGPIAMLLAVPCAMAGQPGVYLYALATAPAWRARGVMSGLMDFSEEAVRQYGARFAALIPANPPLYGYYGKRGYTIEVLLRTFTFTSRRPRRWKPSPAMAAVCFEALTGQRLAALRASCLTVPALMFDAARMDILINDIHESGADLAVAPGGYAVYRPRKERLQVAELAAGCDKDARAILHAIAAHTGHKRLDITLPQASGLFSARGKLERSALIKPLERNFIAKNPYLRFGLE